EEFWGFLNKTKEHEKSIHWERWPEMTDVKIDLEFMSRWDRILMFRDKVLKKIEEARSQKILGTSLEARVLIQTDPDMYKVLDDIRADLVTIFIVSEVELTKGEKDNFKESIVVKRARGDKCQRCWTYSESVGNHQEHTTLCGRCVAAIAEGE
ncbi:isoleucine--tRNA ligase, partial [PVC group bacterium]|nr:isoleucine--tRNA ligase [PVC group bacterium]